MTTVATLTGALTDVLHVFCPFPPPRVGVSQRLLSYDVAKTLGYVTFFLATAVHVGREGGDEEGRGVIKGGSSSMCASSMDTKLHVDICLVSRMQLNGSVHANTDPVGKME